MGNSRTLALSDRDCLIVRLALVELSSFLDDINSDLRSGDTIMPKKDAATIGHIQAGDIVSIIEAINKARKR